MSKRILSFTKGADDWKQFLADPEKHWRIGFSARTLAHCWEEAEGLPDEVSDAFAACRDERLADLQPLLGIPEYKVDLPGGKRASQNDIFVLARSAAGPVTIMVEGKVEEPFDKRVDEWMAHPTAGRTKRLAFLQKTLGLQERPPGDVRYQLLHRAASAVIEGNRFRAAAAVLLIHTFTTRQTGWSDYARFLDIFGVAAESGAVQLLTTATAMPLYAAWVPGNPVYLTR